MALAQVVQQIGNALGNAFALCFQGLFLRIGIEREEITRRHGRHPLFNAKTDTRAGFFVGFDRFGQLHQRACIEQIGSG